MAVSLDVHWLLELGDRNSRLVDTIDAHRLAVTFYVYPSDSLPPNTPPFSPDLHLEKHNVSFALRLFMLYSSSSLMN